MDLTYITNPENRAVPVKLTNRIVEIKTVDDFTIEGGVNSKVFTAVDVSNFTYIWLAVYPTVFNRPYDAYVQWMVSSGLAYTGQIPIFSASTRDISDWFEVKALLTDISVKNNHSEPQIFKKITLFGVR